MNKRLARSRTDVMLGGVCAGLANFLGIDPVIVRIFFVLLVILDGAGILIYLLLWLVMPKEDATTDTLNISDRARDIGTEFGQAVSKPNPNAAIFIGVGLILAGVVVFLRSLDISWLHWLDGRITLPLLLLLAGGFLLYRAIKER
jgi:phage shock protein PspC (stress-responsive transcriptional regulator)